MKSPSGRWEDPGAGTGADQESGLGHPSRDAEQAVGHTGLEARGLTGEGWEVPRGAE